MHVWNVMPLVLQNIFVPVHLLPLLSLDIESAERFKCCYTLQQHSLSIWCALSIYFQLLTRLIFGFLQNSFTNLPNFLICLASYLFQFDMCLNHYCTGDISLVYVYLWAFSLFLLFIYLLYYVLFKDIFEIKFGNK